MASYSSATAREQSPHLNRTTRTATMIDALKRRAQALLNDQSLDSRSRAIIRYALQTHDPWLAELVRRADADESVFNVDESNEASDFSEPYANNAEDSSEKVETLIEIICRSGDEPEIKSAALLVLMGTLENATHSKALANAAKHLAFTRCGEMNLNGIVDVQVAALESELLA